MYNVNIIIYYNKKNSSLFFVSAFYSIRQYSVVYFQKNLFLFLCDNFKSMLCEH